MNSKDPQIQLVLKLKEDIYNLKKTLEHKKAELESEQYILQKKCEKTGHNYISELNHDCHNPGRYYTCKYCGYFTLYRPTNVDDQACHSIYESH